MSFTTYTTTFPIDFDLKQLRFAIDTIDKVFDAKFLDLAHLGATLDTQDHTVLIGQKLVEIQNDVAKFKFENSYLTATATVITSHDDWKMLRKEVFTKMYHFGNKMQDIGIWVKQELFNLAYNRTDAIDSTVSIVNALGEQAESTFTIRSKLALDNLRAIENFYVSIGMSSLSTILSDAWHDITQANAVVSLGSKTSADLEDRVTWKDIVKF